MGSATNPQGQTAAKNKINQFLGNLGSQGYAGKDGASNAAMDAHGVGTAALYGTLAVAAGETGKMPGPIGWTGNAVSVVVGVATAPSASSPTCAIVGTIASIPGGIVGGAVGGLGGPVLSILGGAAGGYGAQKVATAACQTALGYESGEPAASPASTAANLQQTLSTSSVPSTPRAPTSTNASSTAAQIVQFRSSPDYSGTDGAFTVQRGQTLTAIAKSNGISLSDLVAANPQITDPNSIRTGQVIRLPATATGYTPGTSGDTSIPNDTAQTNALSGVLNQSAGQSVDVVTENSGRIAVLSSSAGTATVINNDGSVTQMSLNAYNQQAQNTYNQMLNKGYVSSSDLLSVVNYQDGLYGTTNINGSVGTVDTSAGMIFQDASGNIVAQSSTGQLYAYDATTQRNLFAQNNADGTLSTDVQKSTTVGITDDLRNFTSQEAIQNEQLITTSTNGAATDQVSGTGAIVNLSNAVVTLAEGASATINGSQLQINVGANSQTVVNGQDLTIAGSSGATVTANRSMKLSYDAFGNPTVLLGGATVPTTAVSNGGIGLAENTANGGTLSGQITQNGQVTAQSGDLTFARYTLIKNKSIEPHRKEKICGKLFQKLIFILFFCSPVFCKAGHQGHDLLNEGFYKNPYDRIKTVKIWDERYNGSSRFKIFFVAKFDDTEALKSNWQYVQVRTNNNKEMDTFEWNTADCNLMHSRVVSHQGDVLLFVSNRFDTGSNLTSQDNPQIQRIRVFRLFENNGSEFDLSKIYFKQISEKLTKNKFCNADEIDAVFLNEMGD